MLDLEKKPIRILERGVGAAIASVEARLRLYSALNEREAIANFDQTNSAARESLLDG